MSLPVPPTVSPAIPAAQLRRLLDGDRRELAVIDVRTPLARTKGHLAVSTGVPLHELEQRIRVVVPRRTTPLVLASDPDLDARAARLLKDLGYTDVAVLEGGLDGWVAAGERLYTGTNVRSTTLGAWIELELGTGTGDVDTGRTWALGVLESAEAPVIGADELERLQASDRRTTYLIDVRRPEEHAAGHLPGSLPIQGGELVQCSDEHLAVRRSRVVLVDTEDLVRSAGTVQWLRYLHDGPLHVIVHDPSLDGPDPAPPALPDVATVTTVELEDWLARDEPVRVLDLRTSSAYRAGHLRGSVHARREHLRELLRDEDGRRTVLVGDASYAPHFAAAELLERHGIATWVLVGDLGELPLTTDDPTYAGEVVDQVGPPESGPERDRWYEEHFEWEYLLVPSSLGDPDFAFGSKKP